MAAFQVTAEGTPLTMNGLLPSRSFGIASGTSLPAMSDLYEPGFYVCGTFSAYLCVSLCTLR
jgi:hypothetical protein